MLVIVPFLPLYTYIYTYITLIAKHHKHPAGTKQDMLQTGIYEMQKQQAFNAPATSLECEPNVLECASHRLCSGA